MESSLVTSAPSPWMSVSVSGLSTSSPSTDTFGSLPKSPVTVRPSIVSLCAAVVSPPSSPQAAVADRTRAARGTAARLRRMGRPSDRGPNRATLAAESERSRQPTGAQRGPWTPPSHPVDELVDALVVRPEGVLAEHRALCLVVELEVDPVDGEVAPPLLRPLDELSSKPGPGGLRWAGLGLEHA